MTPEQKVEKLENLFAGEFKQIMEDALLYVKYKEGYDVPQTYEEVMTRGKRAYQAIMKFYEVMNSKDYSEGRRTVDHIALHY